MENGKKSVKYGKIEFYRFVFCIGVLMFHVGKYLRGEPSLKEGIHFEFFPHGALGVEFFFLLSGFFMARSVYKKVCREEAAAQLPGKREDSREYVSYMLHKYVRLLPEHVPAFLLTLVVYLAVNGKSFQESVFVILNNIPSFLMIQMSGIYEGNVLHIEWYLSCMLLAMAVLYPICRKHYFSYTRYYGPLCSVFVLGYLYYTTKALTGVSVWLGFGYKSMLRALVEITLGAFCFECSRYLAGSRFVNQKKWRILLGCTEFFCFVGVICLIMLTVSKKYEFYALGLLVLMVIIAGSGMAYGAQWFDNRLCYFLGKLSLPIYLAQLAAIYLVNGRYTQWKLRYQMLFACVLTFVIAFGIMACAKPIRKVIDRFEHR